MLEKKIRDKALAEHLKTRKAVDRLLSKNRRMVKTVDGYREKAMVSSGTGARISMSQSDIVKGVDTKIFSQADALKLAKYLHNHYSYTRVRERLLNSSELIVMVSSRVYKPIHCHSCYQV